MKATTLKQLGAYIRDQRRRRNWTQQQLADASGTLQSWLSGVEKGKGNPEFSKVLAVLRTLDITLDLQPKTTAPRSFSPVMEGKPSKPSNKSIPPSSGEQLLPSKRSRDPSVSRDTLQGGAKVTSVYALRKRFQKGGK